jgi:hypothetical protein
MKLLKMNAAPLLGILVGIAALIVAPIMVPQNHARWHRIHDNGVDVPGEIQSGKVTKGRRGSEHFELEVSYGQPQGRKTTQKFQVPEELYFSILKTTEPVDFLVAKLSHGVVVGKPKLQVRCNPEDPKEAWIAGREPGKPWPLAVWVAGGTLLLAGSTRWLLVLKRKGKLFMDGA